MATNPTAAYGLDVACLDDAADLWGEVSGTALVMQDTYHRLTNDFFLGPGGEEEGYDVTRLLGMKRSTLSVMGPVLSEVVQRDERIETADVGITVAKGATGLDVVAITVGGDTTAGPFKFVLNAADLTVEILEGAP